MREMGRPFFSPLFTGLTYSLDDDRLTRASVLVSRRISPLAARRNRLKRLVMSLMEADIRLRPSGWLVLVIPKPASLESSRADLEKEMKRFFQSLATS